MPGIGLTSSNHKFHLFFTMTLKGIIVLFLQLEKWKVKKLYNFFEVTLTVKSSNVDLTDSEVHEIKEVFICGCFPLQSNE